MPWKIELTGADKLAALLARGGAEAVPALAQALAEEAQLMFRDSQRLVPRDTGTLAASGQVLPAEINGDEVSVTLGYGGAASDYALIVHEDPKARHTGGRQFKYLEVPVLRRIPKLNDTLRRRVERILK